MTVVELAARVSKTSRQAHFAHWATKSFAQHEALGDFYPAVVASLDTFVENYQAYFSLIGSIKIEAFKTSEDIIFVLEDDVRWLTANRNKICRDVMALQNLFDDLTTVYTLAVYKLTNLR